MMYKFKSNPELNIKKKKKKAKEFKPFKKSSKKLRGKSTIINGKVKTSYAEEVLNIK